MGPTRHRTWSWLMLGVVACSAPIAASPDAPDDAPGVATEPQLETALVALDGAADDRFGSALAFSDDASLLLAGLHLDDVGGTDAGSARVFSRSGETWDETALLVASDGMPGDFFGIAVALSVDGTRALVGASRDDTATANDVGTARVFVRVGTSWTEEATLAAAAGQDSDEFGYSVALCADGSRAVVGVVQDDTTAGADTGSAVVFARTGTTWNEEAVLLPSDANFGDGIGSAVAISASCDRVVVGAQNDDLPGSADAGSARVFVRAGTTWSEEATLVAADAAPGDHLGVSVALSADGSRVLVGARDDDTMSGDDAGSARVFVRAGTAWDREATLTAWDAAASDAFGASVALSSDGRMAVVGATLDDTAGGTDAGSARVFSRDAAGVWTEDWSLRSPDAAGSDYFGVAVALATAGNRVAVGAYYDDTAGGVDAGSAGIFRLPP